MQQKWNWKTFIAEDYLKALDLTYIRLVAKLLTF